MGPVIVYTAADRMEAETIVALLRSYRIDATIHADDAAGTGPNLAFVQGVAVKVAPSQVDDARRIAIQN